MVRSFKYLITIYKSNKKMLVTPTEIQEVIDILHNIHNVTSIYGQMEQHGKYNQLHYHGIFNVPMRWYYSQYTTIQTMHIHYKRIKHPNKFNMESIRQYIDKNQ